MSGVQKPESARNGWSGTGLLLVVGCLGACTTLPDAPDAPLGAGAATAPAVPGGAIRVGPDLYQVPIGRDADGCQRYRLYSPTRMVTQAISFRGRDGGFTMDKHAAACDRQASTRGGPAVTARA